MFVCVCVPYTLQPTAIQPPAALRSRLSGSWICAAGWRSMTVAPLSAMLSTTAISWSTTQCSADRHGTSLFSAQTPIWGKKGGSNCVIV